MNIWEKFNPFNISEEEILANKKLGRIYVADFSSGEGKYISTVFAENEDPYDIKLQISSRVEVRITYLTQDETIKDLQICKLSQGKLEKLHLSTLNFEGVLGILQIFSQLDLKSITNKTLILDSNIVNDSNLLRQHLNTILADENGLKMLAELAETRGLVGGDIGNIAKKREAIEIFRRLLTEDEYFKNAKAQLNKTRDEDVWQNFYEKNKWIFGYGLEYVFNSPISKEKFQQTLKGNNFLDKGKRPDGILKTLGLVSFLNIVEIKTHKTELMNSELYRKSNIWQISAELIGAVAQCQQYIRTSVKNLDEFFQLSDEKGNRTGEEIFCFEPKCFLVVGNMQKDFLDENNKVLNPDKLACFEYFRKNILTPEIITFDQLYLRAKNIIEQHS